MTLRTNLNEALKTAMKAGDNPRRDSLRLMMSAIKQVEVDNRQALTDEEILAVLQREARKLRETIAELEGAGRLEAAAEKAITLHVVEEFLPKHLSVDEIRAIIGAAIADTGAASRADMGRVMAIVAPRTKGLADGKLVSRMVSEMLG
jgi:uncharacterized protein